MKKKLIFCTSRVNAKHIKHEARDGVEHIVIDSFTLPPDIVMNRMLYPADEVAKSFKTLERTLAPLEHPEIDGQFLSAGDPIALNSFYVGAWNENVEQIADGRIKISKIINVQEALKSDKGKRLLDRISGMEDGSDSRAIHTSVGVFIEVDELDEPQTNAAGDEFDGIARNMVFDHDAMLLDSVGAATPKNGVGIGINKEKIDVEFVTCDSEDAPTREPVKALDLRTNADHKLSFDQITHELFHLINKGIDSFEEQSWVIAVFDDTFIFQTPNDEMFRSNYSVSDLGDVAIQDTRLPVERVVEFRPINQPSNDEDQTMRDQIIGILRSVGIVINGALADRLNSLLESKSDDSDERSDLIDRMASAAGIDRSTLLQILRGDIETPPDERLQGFAEVLGVSFDSLKSLVSNSQNGDTIMREKIIAELEKLGIKVNAEMSEDDLLAKYNEALTAKSGDDNADDDEHDPVVNEIKALASKIDGLESKLNSKDDDERNKLVKAIASSKQYKGLDEDSLKLLPLEKVRSLAANCQSSVGIGSTMQVNDDGEPESYALPE